MAGNGSSTRINRVVVGDVQAAQAAVPTVTRTVPAVAQRSGVPRAARRVRGAVVSPAATSARASRQATKASSGRPAHTCQPGFAPKEWRGTIMAAPSDARAPPTSTHRAAANERPRTAPNSPASSTGMPRTSGVDPGPPGWANSIATGSVAASCVRVPGPATSRAG